MKNHNVSNVEEYIAVCSPEVYSYPKTVKTLIEILLKNININRIINSNPFPENISWYLAAGCLSQTYWNSAYGLRIDQNIKDYDLVYYDAADLSKESEEKEAQRINKLFKDLNINIEVVNEARVHLWFEEDFGKKIDQYKSCEDAISSWPTTITAIGLTKINGNIKLYSPFGLEDLISLTLRANRPFVEKKYYELKVKKWLKSWPNLKVISWEDSGRN